MSSALQPLAFLLACPLAGGLVLALVGHRDNARDVNVAFSFGTFVAACVLTVQVVESGPMLLWDKEFYIDPLNVFLVTLTAFVGLTTSVFSRPYMRVERDHGKMTPPRMRLYHSMYQLFSFTMLLALTTNNMGIVWVAMEAATLTTVLLVSVYRTAASLEAAWKYFILCGVGIAQALFGTVLLYMAAEKVIGAEGGALLWTHLDAVKGQLDPNIITLAFAFLFIGYGTKVGLVGHRDNARDVNVAFSLCTFIAACVLTVQVVNRGPMLVWDREFYIDALNVFLVALTAFVGLTTAIFSRPYMRVERDHGKMTPPRLRLYHSMYQLFSFTMLLALTTNNLGIVWVAMEAATPVSYTHLTLPTSDLV